MPVCRGRGSATAWELNIWYFAVRSFCSLPAALWSAAARCVCGILQYLWAWLGQLEGRRKAAPQRQGPYPEELHLSPWSREEFAIISKDAHGDFHQIHGSPAQVTEPGHVSDPVTFSSCLMLERKNCHTCLSFSHFFFSGPPFFCCSDLNTWKYCMHVFVLNKSTCIMHQGTVSDHLLLLPSIQHLCSKHLVLLWEVKPRAFWLRVTHIHVGFLY